MPGVVPLVGVTVSQEPPLLVLAAAVKLTALVALTDRCWEPGCDPFNWKPNARLLGVTVMVAELVMWSVTVTVTGLPDCAVVGVIVTVPV